MSDVEYSALPRTMAEARRLGAKHYFTGKPCFRGHLGRRLTSTRSCVTCELERGRTEEGRAYRAAYCAANSERAVVRTREWREQNPDRYRAQCRKPPAPPKPPPEPKFCTIAGCDGPVFARGWCSTHYQRHRRNGDPLKAPKFEKRGTICSVPDCWAPHARGGFCDPHYMQDYVKRNPSYINHRRVHRRKQVQQATPAWLTDRQWHEISVIYHEARRLSRRTGTQYMVDHIVPIAGKQVSGLHVPWNLMILPASENHKKTNRYEPAEVERLIAEYGHLLPG